MTTHALMELADCICGAVVDQEECPYPSAPLLRPDSMRQLFEVSCTNPHCGWIAIGWGADGARKAWNTRPALRTAASEGEVTVVQDEAGNVVAVTRTDDEHRILETLWTRDPVEDCGAVSGTLDSLATQLLAAFPMAEIMQAFDKADSGAGRDGAFDLMLEALQSCERISQLWLPPAIVDSEHTGEAKALHTMRHKILTAIDAATKDTAIAGAAGE